MTIDALFLMYKDSEGLWGMDFTLQNTKKPIYAPFELLERKYIYEIPGNYVQELRKEKTIRHPEILIMDNNADLYEAKNLNDHLFFGFGACIYKNAAKRRIINLYEIKEVVEDIVNLTYETAGERAPDVTMITKIRCSELSAG